MHIAETDEEEAILFRLIAKHRYRHHHEDERHAFENDHEEECSDTAGVRECRHETEV